MDPILSGEEDSLARPDTPLASQVVLTQITTPHVPPNTLGGDHSPTARSPGSSSRTTSDASAPQDRAAPSCLLLPLPPSFANKPQASLTFADIVPDGDGDGSVLPEIASAEISIGPDRSFVETSSGPAARELKRRYDHQIGVGKAVRSPYAITAFVNQHGKQMFRVGHREASAPAASAAAVEQRQSQSQSSRSPRSKRSSRISMHAFPSMFKNGTTSGRPQTANSQSSAPRKLRKTRSIPDMTSLAANTTSSLIPATVSAVTGRAHSQSVTAADIVRYIAPEMPTHKPKTGDIFGDVMNWSPAPNAFTASTHSLFAPGESKPLEARDTWRASSIITHPFGPGVVFDSPSRKPPAMEYLPMPRHLREMQSFDSGLTAKQTDSSRTGKEPSSPLDFDIDRPPSAMRLQPAMTSTTASDIQILPESPLDPTLSPAPETAMLSRYSTDVFDVLQTYRGLPLLEKLSPDSEETTVIKMSLSADGTAAPRDDPRFVIWGEIKADDDYDNMSVAHESLTDFPSTRSSSMSRKRSTRNSRSKAAEAPALRLSAPDTTHKILIGATIERWIAQLTSDLNYDELLDFFLTYRTYVSAVDLCHLLICRFHWALQQSPSSHDETVRRIVRVRTFVAIRYWLLTFFPVDFLPNRELRILISDWLNTLVRDPILKKHTDGLGIVRRLIKVAKECKQSHTRLPSEPKNRAQAKPAPEKQSHVLGEKFAEAIRKIEQEDDSDLDLDFLPDDAGVSDRNSTPNPANAHLSTIHVGAGFSPTRPVSMPLTTMSILHRTADAPGPTPNLDIPFTQTPAALPIHHNAFSRAFVKTIGRLGRWKRVLNSRATGRPALDLLAVNGGVEHYLKMIETPQPSPLSAISPPPPFPQPIIDQPIPPSTPPSLDLPRETSATSVKDDIELPTPDLREEKEPDNGITTTTDATDSSVLSSARSVSLRSNSTDSFGTLLTSSGGPPPSFPAPPQPQLQFDVVSIDDLDLSDNSSDSETNVDGPPAPPGLRRLPRKLPMRRDFEFVRRSESVSSMGITSHISVASPSSSATSSVAVVGLGGNIQQWQVNAIPDSSSDDEEPGDAEAALRRLEGQINPQRQQERVWEVDNWIRTIQERMAAGDYSNEAPRFPGDDDDDDDGDDNNSEDDGDYDYYDDPAHSSPRDNDVNQDSAGRPTPSISGADDTLDTNSDLPRTPMPNQTQHSIPPPRPNLPSPSRSGDAKPAPEDAVPAEILESRVPSSLNFPTSAPQMPALPPTFGGPDAPRTHRSFVLNHRAEVLVQHFSMIDRELFIGVKFEELVLDDWMACEEVDVLDWTQFLKDRARWKVESRWREKTTALAAVRARFNLMANFIISEIVLTHPTERPVLVAKFIRIAWKAYNLCNYHTLVAIITALQSDWVNRAMRRSWNRLTAWENRMFKDLKIYTTNQDDFKYIRQTVDAIVDAKPIDRSSHATSVVSGGGTDVHSGKSRATSEARPPAPMNCIPFIGVYLSQLRRHSQLPDLIDPTAPNQTVGIDPISANFDAPAHPEVFSALAPLPPSMHLEPLINVHKQRRIAGVIKSLVAGQHLASRVHFEVDKKLFQRCLRLHGLGTETLERVLTMFPE
ncbi:hypothetical protein BD779DRAFT_1672040 [Infundibulicybe gibba]|nr:hypothetical protein BD779DRAFT_1672040 [Infundibulicybe gibba]